MPDVEGYLVPGELGVGSYAAFEGDLGEKLTAPLGFGRDLEELSDEDVVWSVPAFGVSTGRFSDSEVRYVCPEQSASWLGVWPE